jgi:hypothetical protein
VVNWKKLDDVWDGKTPVTELWERISDIRELAAYANAAISDNDCITAVLQATESIPDFADVVRKYFRIPPASWKWDVVIMEFTAVDGGRDFKTRGERGYHAANAVTARQPNHRRDGVEPNEQTIQKLTGTNLSAPIAIRTDGKWTARTIARHAPTPRRDTRTKPPPTTTWEEARK